MCRHNATDSTFEIKTFSCTFVVGFYLIFLIFAYMISKIQTNVSHHDELKMFGIVHPWANLQNRISLGVLKDSSRWQYRNIELHTAFKPQGRRMPGSDASQSQSTLLLPGDQGPIGSFCASADKRFAAPQSYRSS